jgi:hypothetical protein
MKNKKKIKIYKNDKNDKMVFYTYILADSLYNEFFPHFLYEFLEINFPEVWSELECP